MKHIWIKYRNRAEDIVDQKLLDNLLDQGAIEEFFRPSECRWIRPGVDRIRVARRGEYEGPEERRVGSLQMVRDVKMWRKSPTEDRVTGYPSMYSSGTLAASVPRVPSVPSS